MAGKGNLWFGLGGGLCFIVGCVGLMFLQSERVAKGYEFEEQLTRATKAAVEREPDAELAWASARYVEPNGHIRLPTGMSRPSFSRAALRDGVTFIYRSARRAAVPIPKGMPGAPASRQPRKLGCRVEVQITPGGGSFIGDNLEVTDESMDDPACGRSVPHPPRCTLAQVWNKAIAKGAPTPALADLELSASKGEGFEWKFTIIDRTKVGPDKYIARMQLADDCSKP